MDSDDLLVSFLVFFSILVVYVMTVPKGIRNNNPGNLRPGGATWQGQTGVDASNLLIFDSPANGLRAASRNLYNYGAQNGINTLTGVANRWAPSGDADNDPGDYANTLSSVSGYGVNDTIDLTDPTTNANVVAGIVQAENGLNAGLIPWFTVAQIQLAYSQANGEATA